MAVQAPLIHIGYHKTGSNWLRRNLFPNQKLGFYSFQKEGEIHDYLVYPNALDFDPEKAKAYFYPRIETAIKQGLFPVVASENLSGNPHSGGYYSKEFADRLSTVFPDGKILIVVREQESIILAQYQQYVRIGGHGSLDEFLCPPESGRSRIPLFDFDHYKYHRVISYYQQLFGKEQVLVLAYEYFKENSRDFVSRIIDFAGVRLNDELFNSLPLSRREHQGFTGLAISVKRRLNPLILKDRVNYVVPFPLPNAIDLLERTSRSVQKFSPRKLNAWLDNRRKERIRQLVGDRYRESNRITQKLTGLDLAKYGYKV